MAFQIKNGVLTKYTEEPGITDVVIPDGVTGIWNFAFQGCKRLTGVTIPESVTSIGGGAFVDCVSLTSVAIPEGIASIVDKTFSGCESLTSVTIPESVTKIRDYAFSDCKSLTSVTIPESVTSIGSGAFKGCVSLTSVAIPEGIASIVNETFSGCESLISVTIPESVICIGDCAFSECRNLTSVTIPKGVTSIGGGAFVDCESLTSVTIPESVTSIGNGAFWGCERLIRVTIPEGVTSIGYSVFNGCERLSRVTIPEGVTSIGDRAFCGCENLTSVVIPESVTCIGNDVFNGCEHLTSVTIPESVSSIGTGVFFGCKRLTSITIPESVTNIGNSAFRGCKSLTSVTIPEGVTSIGEEAFSGCKSLTSVTIPASVTRLGERVFEWCDKLSHFEWRNPKGRSGKLPFGEKLPAGLSPVGEELYPRLSDGSLKEYCLENGNWEKLPLATRAGIFLTCQGKALLPVYAKCVTEPDVLGEEILTQLSGTLSAKTCGAAANFLLLFSQEASPELLRRLYERLRAEKAAAKTLQTVETDAVLMEQLAQSQLAAQPRSAMEETLTRLLQQEKKSALKLTNQLTEFYGIKPADLPEVRCKDGSPADASVLTYLLTVHEKLGGDLWEKQRNVLPAYKTPGVCPHAAEVLALLDPQSLQEGLLALADRHLGQTGRGRKLFLAYPICRYADEATMQELTKRAPQWASGVSGNDAPPLLIFRAAVPYSETRSAMLFAEKYRDLGKYAAIRGTTADAVRDQYLSDIGLDERGGRQYDLGNQTVTARLQPDLSFLVELPGGKTAKSLPKKGADPEKYEAAKTDLDQRKKAAKRIVKARGKVLFEDFLSGRERAAEDWQAAYLHNPLLRSVAKLLVWSQGKNTFTLTDSGAIRSSGKPYAIGKSGIRMAHPIEMTPGDVSAWQEYFRANGLKQPFEQIWEPAYDPAKLREDRYKGCAISYRRAQNAEKHGIHYYDEDFHNWVYFTLDDCQLENELTDSGRHELYDETTFTLGKFTFRKYTRKVNHIVYLFDKWTIQERIQKDDIDVMKLLDRYNAAQITEFLNIAAEYHATNLTAALLEYKHTHFPAYDAFAEFTLD